MRYSEHKAAATSVYIFYHANCLDGITAAWVVNQRTYKHFPDWDTIIYSPLQDSSSSKDDILSYLPAPEARVNTEIYFLGVSVSPEVAKSLFECLPRLQKLVILDHHESAKVVWGTKDIHPNCFTVFNPNWSAAALAYCYFNRLPISVAYDDCFYLPPIIKYVQDQELRKFRHGEVTRRVNKWLTTISPKTFQDWTAANRRLDDDLGSILPIDAASSNFELLSNP